MRPCPSRSCEHFLSHLLSLPVSHSLVSSVHPRIDAWTFCCKSLSLSLSLSQAILVVSHSLHFLTLLRLALSAVPALTVTITSALWLHVSCCSHRRVSNSMPRLQVSLLMPTCAPHMAYLLKRHLCDPGYVQLSQPRPHSLLLVPSMWERVLHDQLLQAREVPVPPWWVRTILLLQILVQGLALFLNCEPSFFFWSTLVGHGRLWPNRLWPNRLWPAL